MFIPDTLFYQTGVCDKILEEEGVYGRISFIDAPVFFFPLDFDLISLELNDAFTPLFVVTTMI